MDTSDSKSCSYCLSTLQSPYIICQICPAISLCVCCFSLGAEGGKHLRSHDYKIASLEESATTSLFQKDSFWNFTEEVKLLDSIDVFGMGNWYDVALKVETKSIEDCLDHYVNFYLRGSIGSTLLSDKEVQKVPFVEDLTAPPGAPLSPSLYQSHQPLELSAEEQQMLGFMPLRDDFERDYDNEAESILCKLQPSFEEEELDNLLKVAQIDIYTNRLRERQRRKLIARQHNLTPHIMNCILDRPVNTLSSGNASAARRGIKYSERYNAFTVDERLKPFFRYICSQECKQFLDNIQNEESLKSNILQLIELRKKGVKKLNGNFHSAQQMMPRVSSRNSLSNGGCYSLTSLIRGHRWCRPVAANSSSSKYATSSNSTAASTRQLTIKVTRRNGQYLNGFTSNKVSPIKLSCMRIKRNAINRRRKKLHFTYRKQTVRSRR